MAAPSPSLSLSDIMHPFSPPPGPIPYKSTSPPPRSPTPEPLELAEIEEMRRKVTSMGWGDSSKGKEKAGSKEQELADMLLRLTHPASLPQPSQLHAQAETISHLIQQRDFLVKRSIEEQERWESEKDGWARAAQALIIQGRRESAKAEKEDAAAAQYSLITVDPAAIRMLEFERANVVLQNEKKSIQQKLTDTQARLSSLESELAQLKPLLLMQPFALTHSHPTGTTRGWSAVLPSSTSAAASRRERDRHQQDADVEMEEEPESEGESPQRIQPRPQFRNPVLRPASHDPTQPQPPTTPNKPKGDYYRHRDPPPSTIHYPSAQYVKSAKRKIGLGAPTLSNKPVLSDARAEHLLLAARKIGRHRASILSGAFAHVQQQPDPAPYYKQKPPSKTTGPQPPRTPRRNANPNTPLLTRTPLGLPGTSGAQPRTPLQSLLSAAQSVLSASGGPSSSTTQESPLAKRRKVDTSVTVIKSADTPVAVRRERERGKEKTSGIARVRSALDFLADQAEVYSTQPASQDGAESGGSQQNDRDEEEDVEVEVEDPTPPDDTAVADKGKEKEKTSDRAGTPPNSQPGRNSRRSTPAGSSLTLDPGQLLSPPAEVEPNHRDSTPASVSNASVLTLAPPIDLTPRTSRSPAPQPGASTELQPGPNPRKRRRSASPLRPVPRATSAPAIDSPSGSGAFAMFALQRPQSVAPVSSAIFLGEQIPEEQEQDEDQTTSPKVVEGVKFAAEMSSRRTRSPYIKWTKEEDEQLAKAVAKYGQKWDLVQKALPSRGYHQVRQRWLRKLGVFDGSKLDLSSLETNAAAEFLNISTAPPTDDNGLPLLDPRPSANPKLGLAPLNSEKLPGSSSSSTGRSLSPFPTGAGGGSFPSPSETSDSQVGSNWPAGEGC